jgi:ATP-dependent Clp protease protease subunit
MEDEDYDNDVQVATRKTAGLEDRIDDELIKARRVFLCQAVDDKSSREIIRKLWYLELTQPKKPILFVINSPGGSVDAGLAIWDAVQMISSPVTTLVTGIAASMGSVLSLCAAPGRRFATPYSRIMIHQPRIMGVIEGQATDLDLQAKEIVKTRNMLVDVYVSKTKKDRKTIEKAIDRDTWYSAEEALEYGLLDKIVGSFDDVS